MEKLSIPKDYTKKTVEDSLAKVAAFFKKHNVDGELSIRSIYFAQGGSKFQKTKSVAAEIHLPYSEISKKAALQKELNKDVALSKMIQIQCKLDVGEKFQDITDVDRPLGTEGETVSHTPGTVMLVDFWATWCGPCQQPMARNQEMLVKNANIWKDKVRIVGLSLDSKVLDLTNRIKQQGWNKIDHYIVPGAFKHPGPESYDCHGIPFVVLVDKTGTIVYTGHPNSIDLEQTINKYLQAPEDKESKVSTKKEYEAESGVPKESYNKLRQAVKENRFSVPKVFNQSQLSPTTTPEDLVFQSTCVLIHSRKFDPDLKKLTVERQRLVLGGEMSMQAAQAYVKAVYIATTGIPQGYIVPRIKPVQIPTNAQGGCNLF